MLVESSRTDSSTLRAITGIITLSSKLPAAPAHDDGGVVADHLGADHQRRLRQHRVDLAGHDARPRLQVGQPDLGQPGGRPAGQPAQVVADLGEADRDRPQHAAQLDEGVAAALGLEVVARLGERLAASARRAPRSRRRRSPAGVLMPVPTAVPPSGSSRTRGSTASSRSRASASVAAYPPSSWPSITGVASIRWVRPDFTSPENSSALARRLSCEDGERGLQVLDDRLRGGDVDRRREGVVARLAGVDVVVGVDVGAGAGGEAGEHLVHVHVGAGARAGLEDVDREVVEVLARGDAAGGRPRSRRPAPRSTTPSRPLVRAAACLTSASARTSRGSSGVPLIGKFSTARWVWARHSASAGTAPRPSSRARSGSRPRSGTVPVVTAWMRRLRPAGRAPGCCGAGARARPAGAALPRRRRRGAAAGRAARTMAELGRHIAELHFDYW